VPRLARLAGSGPAGLNYPLVATLDEWVWKGLVFEN